MSDVNIVLNSAETAIITIRDVAGNIIRSFEHEKETHHRLDISEFAQGVYFVTLNTDKGIKTKQLIVQ
jgi:hypothetical protein